MTSERVEQLDPPAEVFYRRLMSKVDDHGLYDARPSILRASLYPLRIDRVREADCSRWIAACEKAGLIALYQHDGKPYLQMLDTRWQARSEAKYPIPPANSCAQVQTVAQVVVVGDGDEDGKKARKRAFDAEGLELPDWLPRDLWVLWAKDRKARGKAMTEAAARLSVKKLDEFRAAGTPPAVVIEHSIANGYQGLFAPARNGSQPVAAATTSSDSAEKTRAMLDSYEQTPEQRAAAAEAARRIREQRGLKREAA